MSVSVCKLHMLRLSSVPVTSTYSAAGPTNHQGYLEQKTTASNREHFSSLALPLCCAPVLWTLSAGCLVSPLVTLSCCHSFHPTAVRMFCPASLLHSCHTSSSKTWGTLLPSFLCPSAPAVASYLSLIIFLFLEGESSAPAMPLVSATTCSPGIGLVQHLVKQGRKGSQMHASFKLHATNPHSIQLKHEIQQSQQNK